MMVFKKEIFDFVESLIEERVNLNSEKRLFTVEEAAKILNIKVSRIRAALFQREITYIKIGALVRFRQSDIDSFIEKNLVKVSTTHR